MSLRDDALLVYVRIILTNPTLQTAIAFHQHEQYHHSNSHMYVLPKRLFQIITCPSSP